jgi:DNA-binding transcriptional MerR regulator
MNFQPRAPAAPTRLVAIGDAAGRLGVSARTLRYYQDQGLIRSHRLARNIRGYDLETITRLETIVALRAVDLPIADIRGILALDDNPPAQAAAMRVALTAALRAQQERVERLMAMAEDLAAWRQGAPLLPSLSGWSAIAKP